MPRGVWKVLLWTSLAMLFRCCGALSSRRLSVVPAPQPEPSLWWSLYGGEATMTLGFYCGFKRNVLFRCCGALSSRRLSVVPAPKPEPSLWWSLYGGEATKALGFYCRFKRNVWHRADAKGVWKALLWTSLAMLFRCCGALSSGLPRP